MDGNNVPKFGSMVTKYFSSHSQNERYGLCHQNVSLSCYNKAYMCLIMGLLSASQLYPCVLTLIMFHSWQIQYCSKSGGWLTRLRQHKTSIFSSLCHCHEAQLQLLCREFQYQWQRLMPIMWYIYIYVYIHTYVYILHFVEHRTGMLSHPPLESSRRQRRIATVYSWHTHRNWQTAL